LATKKLAMPILQRIILDKSYKVTIFWEKNTEITITSSSRSCCQQIAGILIFSYVLSDLKPNLIVFGFCCAFSAALPPAILEEVERMAFEDSGWAEQLPQSRLSCSRAQCQVTGAGES
jgi:hypothetical protein